MKKFMVLLTVLVMLLTSVPVLHAEGEWKFERKVDFICPWGVGGGADSTLRPMADIVRTLSVSRWTLSM